MNFVDYIKTLIKVNFGKKQKRTFKTYTLEPKKIVRGKRPKIQKNRNDENFCFLNDQI